MSFTAAQIRKLRTKPNPRWIRSREKGGVLLHYIEGAHAIAEANRILGHDAWDRETLSNTCVWSKQLGPNYSTAYLARVRLTVHISDRIIVREAWGAGEAQEATPGAAHERACKSAETDATKRALCTLGNASGLGLYTKPPNQSQQPAPTRQMPPLPPSERRNDGLQSFVEEHKPITTEN